MEEDTVDDFASKLDLSRRKSLGLAVVAASALAAPACARQSSAVPAEGIAGGATGSPAFKAKLDFADPIWNRDTYARVDGELDFAKQKVSRITGKVYGVRDNEVVRPLFTMDGFSVVRTMQLPDGNWRRLLKEIVFYRDLESGEIMQRWKNPYTGEAVKVVPIANDPFNYDIRDTVPRGPRYGGLNEAERKPDPFLLDWVDLGDKLLFNTGIDLFYPAALQPDQWPRESAGTWNRVSEHFQYVMEKADVLNPSITAIPVTGSWSRLTPWLPWMLMGQGRGCINYFTHFYTVKDGIAGLPDDLVEAAKAVDPGYLVAPTKDYGPSLSSLENYKLTETPAPVPPGWAPPAEPEVPPLPSRMQRPA